MAQGDIHPVSTLVLRGRHGTYGTLGRRWSPAPVTRHFARQAWHLETSTFVSRGRRGTISHLPSLCVASVALMALRGALGRRWSPVTPRHFAWQAWRLVTSTFVLHGRRGTRIHPPSFHVALTALRGALGRRWSPATPRHFAWQAWHKETSTFVLRGCVFAMFYAPTRLLLRHVLTCSIFWHVYLLSSPGFHFYSRLRPC